MAWSYQVASCGFTSYQFILQEAYLIWWSLTSETVAMSSKQYDDDMLS